MNDIGKIISEKSKLTKAIAMCMCLMAGIKNKKLAYLTAFESEFGRFPEDINEFAKKIMRLQGYNPDVFFYQEDIDVLVEIHDIPDDRVLMIVIAH